MFRVNFDQIKDTLIHSLEDLIIGIHIARVRFHERFGLIITKKELDSLLEDVDREIFNGGRRRFCEVLEDV